MRKPKWDYRNLIQDGMNVFFYRDTDHVSETIQARIYSEMSARVRNGAHRTLFCEGRSDVFSPSEFKRYSSESKLRAARTSSHGRSLGADELIAYRHLKSVKGGKLSIVGVDSEELLDKQAEIIREISCFEDISSKRDLTEKESIEQLCLFFDSDSLTKQRSLYSAETVVDYMNSHNVRRAALFMGEDHFRDISSYFKKSGVGYASFYPGDGDSDGEDILNYIGKI